MGGDEKQHPIRRAFKRRKGSTLVLLAKAIPLAPGTCPGALQWLQTATNSTCCSGLPSFSFSSFCSSARLTFAPPIPPLSSCDGHHSRANVEPGVGKRNGPRHLPPPSTHHPHGVLDTHVFKQCQEDEALEAALRTPVAPRTTPPVFACRGVQTNAWELTTEPCGLW